MPTKRKQTSKKAKSTAKPRVQQRQLAISQRRARPDVGHIVHKVCALTDPFCPAAVGAKWPNSTAIRTLAYPFHSRRTVAVTATGAGAVIFTPGYNNWTAGATIDAETGNALFTNYATAPKDIGAALWRIVSWGFKIRSVASPMLASGMVRVRIFAPAYSGANNIDPTSYLCEDFIDVPLQDCKELCVIPQRSGELAEIFNASDVGGATIQSTANVGWPYVLVSVDGAPASTVPLDIEVYYNYELMFSDGNALSMLMTPSPSASGLMTQAASYVTKSLGSFVKQGAKQVEGAVKTAASRYIGGLLGGPMGAAAGGMLAITVD